MKKCKFEAIAMQGKKYHVTVIDHYSFERERGERIPPTLEFTGPIVGHRVYRGVHMLAFNLISVRDGESGPVEGIEVVEEAIIKFEKVKG